MKLNKPQLINDLKATINQQISLVSNHFLNAPESVLQKPAPDGGWTILQCLDHLNSYGHYYLPEIEKALQHGKKSVNDVYKTGWLGDYFEKIMSPHTGKKKHKAFKGHIPAVLLDSDAVLNEFIRQETLLLEYLETSREIDLASSRVPISIAQFISIRLGDTFRFIIAHNKRHIKQAMRHLEN